MKKVYIAVICLSVVLCGVFGTLFFRDYFSAQDSAGSSAAATADSAQDVSLNVGEAAVLSIGNRHEKDVRSWSSANPAIVTVDSGGRIDGVKPGEASVVAGFADGSSIVYTVTVTKPQVAPKHDLLSTAITANQDILAKNLKNKSRLPYHVYVNRLQNCVTVYTYSEHGKYTVPVRAMVCSCGKNSNTPVGDFNIYFHTEWHPLVNDVFAKYTSAFSDDFLFHSVPYTDIADDTLKVEEYNKLGTPASLGCIRMSVGDCKWIYDNCAEDTAITIYDDPTTPGPLGKPATIKITDDTCRWDPTDSAPQNPYNKKAPQISGTANQTIKAGSQYSVTNGVTATDTCGNNITDKIIVTGNVNPDRPGVYRVTYTVTDLLHRKATEDITVTVEE